MIYRKRLRGERERERERERENCRDRYAVTRAHRPLTLARWIRFRCTRLYERNSIFSESSSDRHRTL